MTGFVLTLAARQAEVGSVALLVSEEGEDVDGHGEAATGSHQAAINVTPSITLSRAYMQSRRCPFGVAVRNPEPDRSKAGISFAECTQKHYFKALCLSAVLVTTDFKSAKPCSN